MSHRARGSVVLTEFRNELVSTAVFHSVTSMISHVTSAVALGTSGWGSAEHIHLLKMLHESMGLTLEGLKQSRERAKP